MGLSAREEKREIARNDAPRSLSRLLDAARREERVEAVALSDAEGCFIAAAGPWRDCDELSAWGPAIAGLDPVLASRLADEPAELPRRAEARKVAVRGGTVVVSVRGEPTARGAALDRVAAGCARILGRRERA